MVLNARAKVGCEFVFLDTHFTITRYYFIGTLLEIFVQSRAIKQHVPYSHPTIWQTFFTRKFHSS
jgi:hypothetical protein